jgi:hypothetical protein
MPAWMLLVPAAFAADVRLDGARAALVTGMAPAALSALSSWEKEAPNSTELVSPEDVARYWYYRGVVEQQGGDKKGQALSYFRASLAASSTWTWELDLVPGSELESIRLALLAEQSGRGQLDPKVPQPFGAARAYVDGSRLRGGGQVVEGRHLAQVSCPDGAVYGVWTEFKRPLKWADLCPDGVDLTVVVADDDPPATGDDWDGMDVMTPGPAGAKTLARGTASVEPTPVIAASPPVPLVVTGTPNGGSVPVMRGALAAAEVYWSNLQEPGFRAGYDKAQGELLSATGTVGPADAAAWHRVAALAAWMDKDLDRAGAALDAWAAAAPGQLLPGPLAPDGSALRRRAEQAQSSRAVGSQVTIPKPVGLSLVVDGVATSQRNPARPAIVQVIDGLDLRWTGLVPAGAWTPDWASYGLPAAEVKTLVLAVPEPAPQPDPQPDALDLAPTQAVAQDGPTTSQKQRRDLGLAEAPSVRRVSVPLLASAGGTALLSGGLYALSRSYNAAYFDPVTDGSDDPAALDELRTRTNLTAAGSTGTAVVAVGLGALAFTLGPR